MIELIAMAIIVAILYQFRIAIKMHANELTADITVKAVQKATERIPELKKLKTTLDELGDIPNVDDLYLQAKGHK